MPRNAKPGLWVMEGKWSNSVRDVRSVDPVLGALEGARRAHHVKHHINDADDLRLQLQRWGQAQHSRFNIGYIALHGAPAKVYVGRRAVDLFDLGDCLTGGTLKSKFLHFGSCSVLDIGTKDQQALRQALGVKVVTGFTADVDWFESLAFELLLFEALTWYKRVDHAERYIKKNYGPLAKRLGFVMVRAT